MGEARVPTEEGLMERQGLYALSGAGQVGEGGALGWGSVREAGVEGPEQERGVARCLWWWVGTHSLRSYGAGL